MYVCCVIQYNINSLLYLFRGHRRYDQLDEHEARFENPLYSSLFSSDATEGYQ